jgi:hypothetical protein
MNLVPIRALVEAGRVRKEVMVSLTIQALILGPTEAARLLRTDLKRRSLKEVKNSLEDRLRIHAPNGVNRRPPKGHIRKAAMTGLVDRARIRAQTEADRNLLVHLGPRNRGEVTTNRVHPVPILALTEAGRLPPGDLKRPIPKEVMTTLDPAPIRDLNAAGRPRGRDLGTIHIPKDRSQTHARVLTGPSRQWMSFHPGMRMECNKVALVRAVQH